jgi:archaeosortase A
MDTFETLLRSLVFVSIGLLLYGWRYRTIKGHQASVLGWFLFGLFWLLTIPHFLDNDESVNAIYCFLGFPLFLFLAYHEYLCIKWGGSGVGHENDPAPLGFMAGTVAMSAGMYFLIDTFPEVAAFFVWTTAVETAGFLSLLGYEASAGGVYYEDLVRVPLSHGDQGGISIVLACTAIQSIVIFIAAILTTRVEKDPMTSFRLGPIGRALGYPGGKLPMSRKWKAFLLTVPIILILNIVRTASVIYLVYEGHYDFDFAHNVLSRWVSMFVLIILSYYLFDILPELHDNIMGIPELIKRKPPVPAPLPTPE